VAWSSSEFWQLCNILCILSVSWITSCFRTIEPLSQNQARRLYLVEFASRRYRRRSLPFPTAFYIYSEFSKRTAAPWPPLNMLLVSTFPGKSAKCCGRRFCVSVCLSVCSHISKVTCPNFTKFSVHVNCGRGSVFHWCLHIIETTERNQRRLFRQVRQMAAPGQSCCIRLQAC